MTAAGLLAVVVASIFTGAAVYVNWAEQPARLQLDAAPLVTQWKLSYQRGFAMQAPLALIGFVLGLLAWWQSGDWRWLAGALLLVANWPYTALVIMPTNRKIPVADPRDVAGLVRKWGMLHAVRSLLGLFSTIAFAWAALGS